MEYLPRYFYSSFENQSKNVDCGATAINFKKCAFQPKHNTVNLSKI